MAMEQAIEAADNALGADDPWAGLCGYIRACVEMRSGALASLAGQIEATDEMRGTAQRSMARTREVVDRARRAGRLRANVSALDIVWLIEQFSRCAPGGSGDADPEEEGNVRARLLGIALDGLRAPAPGSLPGRPRASNGT